MDIQKKLAYYKTSRTDEKKHEFTAPVPSSLKALRDHFDGEIIHPETPSLKITRRVKIEHPSFDSVQMEFLARNTIERSFSPERCLFFDLETTGLSGGAGTFAFLIGFLYIKNDELVIDQYFLPDFGREYPLFQALEKFFMEFDMLISYNGKSFDLPLLKNRFLLNRIDPPFLHLPHLDMLHLVRRIWGRSYSSCDLQTLEISLHIAERQNDIPGAFIPQAYFDFLNAGTIHNVIRLIQHNFQDMVSLFELLRRINRVEEHPDGVNGDLNALISLAKLAYEEQHESYMNLITEVFEKDQHPVPGQIKVWKSLLLKKHRKWKLVLPVWEELIEMREFSFFALEELAKYYEHIAKEYTMAMYYTHQALTMADTLYQLTAKPDYLDQQSAFRHRSIRLKQKMDNSAK